MYMCSYVHMYVRSYVCMYVYWFKTGCESRHSKRVFGTVPAARKERAGTLVAGDVAPVGR